MSDSKVIPVRMPEALYEAVVASKPAELKVSTYLLMLIRKGLNVDVEGLSTKTESNRAIVDSSREVVEDVLISSLQSRIAGLEEQLGAVQRIVEGSQAIRSEASEALASIDSTVEAAVQKAVNNCSQLVDTRVREIIESEMGEVLGKSRA